ncbi:DUF421 domain-containing protein [Oscillospiraceae bacterium NSJ-54]|uniref:DUF421 domain-containing protein n=2 Tax=Zongyangia hominis TaxID=2763677 RepID=A0A926EAN6_9FIRM|nr:DUF421 domain-containing protein [Zongyangia hominis]
MGKRQLAELQPSEFVVTILISNVATLPLEDVNIPLIGGAIPILLLVSFEVIVSFITLKSQKARKVVSGSPRVIIRDGVVDQQEMKNLRLSIDDLMAQLRSKDIFDISDVAFAIIETTGSLSVFQNFDARTITPKIMNIAQTSVNDNSPPVVVVTDGVVSPQSLQYLQKDVAWLKGILDTSNVSLKDTFMLTANRSGAYHLIRKER